MIVSEVEASQLSGSSQSDAGTNPTEKKLVEKYEKYPEYLKITFRKTESSLEHLLVFNQANQFSISQLLSKKSKQVVLERLLPLTLFI